MAGGTAYMLFFSVLFLTREEKGWVQTRNVAKVGIALLVSGASIFVIGTFLSPLLVSGIMGELITRVATFIFLSGIVVELLSVAVAFKRR